jgi:DNA processing protein
MGGVTGVNGVNGVDGKHGVDEFTPSRHASASELASDEFPGAQPPSKYGVDEFTLPREAWAAALAALPAMGPARLAALLAEASPEAAWGRIVAGELAPRAGVTSHLALAWQRAAADADVAGVWGRYLEAGVGVAALGSATYPAALAEDVEPPGVLFFAGDPDLVAGPRVAIVGTRRCTRYGRDVAFDLGRELAAAGVAVVSGLALGIDGAAHAGALAAAGAPAIAVVGSGLDVVYPPQHRELWRRVAECGLVLSEAPLGAAPEPWRFPARNRLIAALADVVVVVESHERGGSMHTVTEAVRRDRPVLAVPGPVRSGASKGTNRLLADGAAPACDAGDVLLALGLSPGVHRPAGEGRAAPAAEDAAVLDEVGWQPTSLEQLVARTGAAIPVLASALARLETGGWLARHGAWYERVVRDGAP